MAIYSLEQEYLGIGLDPLASLINHSCKPNAYCLFEGSEIRIRSLQRISAGDEIAITYIDNTVDKHSRQVLLKSRWFFSCTCKDSSNFHSILLGPVRMGRLAYS
jgi:SET domain-containing protein